MTSDGELSSLQIQEPRAVNRTGVRASIWIVVGMLIAILATTSTLTVIYRW